MHLWGKILGCGVNFGADLIRRLASLFGRRVGGDLFMDSGLRLGARRLQIRPQIPELVLYIQKVLAQEGHIGRVGCRGRLQIVSGGFQALGSSICQPVLNTTHLVQNRVYAALSLLSFG